MTQNGAHKSMYGAPRLEFSSGDELRAYYEEKYRMGGYDDGVSIHGEDISGRYHSARRAGVLELLRAKPGERILDAGCGDGMFSAHLAELGCDVDAIDIASNAMAPALRSTKGLRFQQMDVEQLAFEDETFDKIVCVETLEHCLFPEIALAELKRVLKRGGVLVLTYPCLNGTLMRRLGLGPRFQISEHQTDWSFNDLCVRTLTAGLENERSIGVAFDFGVLLSLKRLSRWFARRITSLQLRIRCFPRNSMFVVLQTRRIW